jgi:hypothetical protein
MKRFISNQADIYLRITNENNTHYICDNILIPKTDVIELEYILDKLPLGKYYVHTVPFYNY